MHWLLAEANKSAPLHFLTSFRYRKEWDQCTTGTLIALGSLGYVIYGRRVMYFRPSETGHLLPICASDRISCIAGKAIVLDIRVPTIIQLLGPNLMVEATCAEEMIAAGLEGLLAKCLRDTGRPPMVRRLTKVVSRNAPWQTEIFRHSEFL